MQHVGMARRLLWQGVVGLCVAAGALMLSASAFANAPNPASATAGIQVATLQREGFSGPFTTSPIYALVGTAIEYEIEVTNTGDTALTLALSDPLCTPGTLSGPVQLAPTLSGETLLSGGEAQYTCSHQLTGADASPFTNTATVVGTPSTGPPVVGSATVRANKRAVGTTRVSRCARGKVRRTVRRGGRKVTACLAKRRLRARRRARRPLFTG